MDTIKASTKYIRLENRQYHGKAIADSLERSGYIKALPESYVSSAGITKDDMIERLERFKACGSLVEISKFKEGKTIIRNANYCGLLGCWHCGSRKERQRYKRIEQKIKIATELYKYSYHVTFTIKDGPNVRDLSLFLRESLKRFRKMGQRRGTRFDGGEYAKVKAGIFSQEIVEGENSKEYHTHAHAIFWTDEMIDFRVYDQNKKNDLIMQYGKGNIPKELLTTTAKMLIENVEGDLIAVSKVSKEWHEATNGQGVSIGMRFLNSAEDYKKALKEVIKYATKMNENAPHRVAEILAECHGLRFFSTVKKMRFDRKAGDIPPEPVISDEAPEAVYNIAWDNKIQRYVEFQNGNPVTVNSRDESRKVFQSQTAVILAQYRKERNQMIKQPPQGLPLFQALDALKGHYREKIKRIWQKHDRLTWIPYNSIKIAEKMQESRTRIDSSSFNHAAWYGMDDPPGDPPDFQF